MLQMRGPATHNGIAEILRQFQFGGAVGGIDDGLCLCLKGHDFTLDRIGIGVVNEKRDTIGGCHIGKKRRSGVVGQKIKLRMVEIDRAVCFYNVIAFIISGGKQWCDPLKIVKKNIVEDLIPWA